MEINYPPYKITDKMLNYVSDIMKKIGEANYFESLNRYPELRRKSRIKSIHSSLAIENNQLSLFQVEDVINGKPVIGEKKDIQEVKNAYEAYEQIHKINPYSVDDLKKIHGILTFFIEKDAGKFRNHGEGVFDGNVQIFMAPPHTMVPILMDDLFNWMNEVKDTLNPLILSSIFHYEFVFIHPFHDGNGRTARLWQTAILSHWEQAFSYLPIESMIKKNQEEYYKAIQNCNNVGNSTEFIEFMLKIINDTIDELKSYDLFSTFFGDEYTKFLDSLQDYADKTYEESHKDDVKEPEKPSSKLKNDVMKEKLQKLTSEYVDEVIKPNAKLTDEQIKSVLEGLFEFACWIYNR